MKTCPDCGEPMALIHQPMFDQTDRLVQCYCSECEVNFEICDDCGAVIRRFATKADGGWGY